LAALTGQHRNNDRAGLCGEGLYWGKGKLGRALLDLDRALRQFFGVDGFGETAEMAREETFGNRAEGDIVLRPRETMAFIGAADMRRGCPSP
jgi:hypothetical protein